MNQRNNNNIIASWKLINTMQASSSNHLTWLWPQKLVDVCWIKTTFGHAKQEIELKELARKLVETIYGRFGPYFVSAATAALKGRANIAVARNHLLVSLRKTWNSWVTRIALYLIICLLVPLFHFLSLQSKWKSKYIAFDWERLNYPCIRHNNWS